MAAFELRHALRAAPAELYRAWTDPALLARWIAPEDGFAVTGVEVEARPGGRLAIRLRTPAGGAGRAEGVFRELEPDRRLALAWRVSGTGTPLDSQAESGLAVTFTARGEGTELHLVHGGLTPEQREAFRHAWYGAVGKLAELLPRDGDPFFERVTGQPQPTSRFGGFWPDFTNALARVAGREELGWLTDADAALFRHWIEKGYVVLPGAVAPAAVDRFLADVDARWERPDGEVFLEHYADDLVHIVPLAPEHRARPHKVLDLHGVSPAAREMIFAPAILRFLSQLFERPPLAFQSLLFTYGTEQDMHQDTAYVLLRSPMEFAGCWIALEDVREGSGELQYYEGSHRNPEYLWFGRSRGKPPDVLDERDFRASMHARSRARGLPLVKFRPKKGDALIWHADLVHGGAKERHPGLTRKSLVTHFAPLDVDPEWFGIGRHTPKVRDRSGAYTCHVLRGEDRP